MSNDKTGLLLLAGWVNFLINSALADPFQTVALTLSCAASASYFVLNLKKIFYNSKRNNDEES